MSNGYQRGRTTGSAGQFELLHWEFAGEMYIYIKHLRVGCRHFTRAGKLQELGIVCMRLWSL